MTIRRLGFRLYDRPHLVGDALAKLKNFPTVGRIGVCGRLRRRIGACGRTPAERPWHDRA